MIKLIGLWISYYFYFLLCGPHQGTCGSGAQGFVIIIIIILIIIIFIIIISIISRPIIILEVGSTSYMRFWWEYTLLHMELLREV